MATALLEKRKCEAVQGEADAAPYHWTVERFYRAADADVFDDPSQLDLIQGRIIEKTPQDAIHRAVRVRLGRQFRTAFAGRLVVMEECPIHLAYDTELVADVVVAYGEEADFDARHPVGADIAVLVEVTDTTMASDLGEKAEQYAQAGISEYWVIVEIDNAIVVHREPSPDGYGSVTRLSGEDTLSPLTMPGVTWTINELLGRTEAQ